MMKLLPVLLLMCGLSAAAPKPKPPVKEPRPVKLVSTESWNVEFQIQQLGWDVEARFEDGEIQMRAFRKFSVPGVLKSDGTPKVFLLQVVSFWDEFSPTHDGRLHCLQDMLKAIEKTII